MASKAKTVKIKICYLPFGKYDTPDLGLSILKQVATNGGCKCTIEYYTIEFAHRIGHTYYIIEHTIGGLIGEYLFTSCFYKRTKKEISDHITIEFKKNDTLRMLGTAVRQRIIDISSSVDDFLDSLYKRDNWDKYDIIGFSTSHQQTIASLALARRIKETYKDKIIIFGGSNCREQMGITLLSKFDFIDFVCLGEGDKTFAEFLSKMKKGEDLSKIDGLAGRFQGKIFANYPNCANSPIFNGTPDYSDYYCKRDEYCTELNWGDDITYETSRGCKWGERNKCLFCGNSNQQIVYREKGQKIIERDLKAIKAKYRAREIWMSDQLMPRKVTEVFNKLKADGFDFNIFYESRVLLSKKALEDMYRLGIKDVQFGIESLSDNILRILNKGTSSMSNIQLLKWCSEVGIRAKWNLLTNIPTGSNADCIEQARIMPFLYHLPPPNISRLQLYRFSPLFENPNKYGIRNIRPKPEYRPLFPDFNEFELFNIAYYFDFDCPQGELMADNRMFRDNLRKWHREFRKFGLSYVDDGKVVRVVQQRDKRCSIISLKGKLRSLFLSCDRAVNTNSQGLLDKASDANNLKHLLTKLVNERLVLEKNGRMLSLPINIGRGLDREDIGKLSNRELKYFAKEIQKRKECTPC